MRSGFEQKHSYSTPKPLVWAAISVGGLETPPGVAPSRFSLVGQPAQGWPSAGLSSAVPPAADVGLHWQAGGQVDVAFVVLLIRAAAAGAAERCWRC